LGNIPEQRFLVEDAYAVKAVMQVYTASGKTAMRVLIPQR
jgi:hypothetical protein